jgi:hypothetical protein
VAHDTVRGEGVEHGRHLMPALHALPQHAALEGAAALLRKDEITLAYPDDVYVLSKPDRAGEVFNSTKRSLREAAGVQANLGKCKMWYNAGLMPAGTCALGVDVWLCGKKLTPVVLRS